MSLVRRVRCFAAPVLGLALIGAGWGSTAAAQEEPADRLVLRAVDSRDDEKVKVVVSYSGDSRDLDGLTVRENGREVDAEVLPAAEAGVSNDVTFLVDSSTSTDADALLTNVEEALADYVDELPAGMRVSIVTARAAAQVLQSHTTDVAKLREAITDLTPGGEGGVLAGVVHAGNRVDQLGTVGTIVLLTDGARNESIGVRLAEGGLEEGGAVLHVIGLTEDGFDEGLFSGLARGSGGSVQLTDDPEAIGDLLGNLAPELANLTVATYESANSRGVQDLLVSAGDTTTGGSYVSGGNQIGVHRLVARPGVEPGGPGFLRGETGKTVGLLGVAVAGLLFAFGMISVFVREDTALSTALKPYADSFVAEEGEGDEGDGASAQTALLRRAVEATESFAERQGVLTKVEHLLEKADLPLRAGEAIFFYLAGVFLLLGLSFALTQNLLGTLVISLFGILIPPAVVNFLATRKKKAFEALLPDTLQLLSSTLRAGYSMMQGVEAVSQEAAEPMGKELRRVVTEARLGRPLEEALDGIAERMGSADFAWAVMAIRIQREVGGNLAELLMTVAETMTHRERLRRDINSLTAEGRMSAYVLLALPVGLGLVLYTSNRDYMGVLFEESLGQIILGGAILGMLVGYLWMMKIIKIEI